MKKITGLFILMVAAIAFVSCDPVENRIDPANGRTAVTMADIDKYVTVTQQTIEGKASNYFSMNSDGLQALSQFQHGLGTIVGPGTNNQYVQCFVVPGEQTIVFTALNADGTRVSKTFNVNVEKCFNVAPEWALLCGTGSKDWTWDTSVGNPYGMGDAINSNSADWWGPDISTNPEGPGATMTFTASGALLTKNLTNGTTVQGVFSFTMGKTTPPNFARSKGTLSTSIPVLVGQTTGAATGNGPGGKDVKDYQIIKLDENHLQLCWPEKSFDPSAGWGQATLWFFKPAQ